MKKLPVDIVSELSEPEQDDTQSSVCWDADTGNPVKSNTHIQSNNATTTDLMKICAHFESGVKLSAKKHHLRRITGHVFSGSDAVSFLVDNKYASSREEGLKLGRTMAYEFALFVHVSLDHDLEDSTNLQYKFTPKDQRVEPSDSSQTISTDLDYISDAFEEGVEVGVHSYHYRNYRNTFVGRDAVTFLVTNHMAKSRQDAVRVGNLLLDRGIFKHCVDDHNFKDKLLFYRFVPTKDRRRMSRRDMVPIEELAARFRELVKSSSDPHRPFQNAFSGSRAVDSIINGGLVSSRAEAVELGQKLVSDLHLFFSVCDNKPFLDNAHTYYQYHDHDTGSNLHWLNEDVNRDWDVKERDVVLDENDGQTCNTSHVEHAADMEDSVALEGVLAEASEYAKAVCEQFNLDMKAAHDREQEEDDYDDCDVSGAGSLEDYDLFGEDCTPCRYDLDEEEADAEDTDTLGELGGHESHANLERSHYGMSAGMSAFNLSMKQLEDEEELDMSGAGSLTDDSYSSARCYDKFGFIVENEQVDAHFDGSATNMITKGNELNAEEWEELLERCAVTTSGEVPKAALRKVKQHMRLGLPDSMRRRAWTAITGVDVLMPEREGDYDSLVEEGHRVLNVGDRIKERSSSMGGIASGQSIKGVIERDLHRTFPRHILFAGSEEVQKSDAVKDTVDDVESNCDEETQGKRTSLSTADTQNQDNDINHLEGPAALRRLLYAYNVYDEEVGYCQGMNCEYLTGMLCCSSSTTRLTLCSLVLLRIISRDSHCCNVSNFPTRGRSILDVCR